MVKERLLKKKTTEQQPRDARGRYAAFGTGMNESDDEDDEKVEELKQSTPDPPKIIPVVKKETATQHEAQSELNLGSTLTKFCEILNLDRCGSLQIF